VKGKNTVKHRGSNVMPQKQKVAIEEKIRIVRECLKDKVSISEAAQRVGADHETMRP
jgi:transposase-like protein